MRIKILKERTSANPINVDLLDPQNPRHIETLLKILNGKVDSNRLKGDIASLQDKVKQALTWKNEYDARERGHKGYGKNKVYWNPHVKKWEADQSTGTISKQTGRHRKALYQPERGKIDQDLYDIGKERNIGTHAFRNAVNTLLNFGLMFADPSGQFAGFEDSKEGGKRAVSSAEMYNRAKEDYNKNPSIFTGAMVALSALAFVPVVGAIGKGGRAAAKKIRSSMKARKAAIDAIENAKTVRKEIKNLPAAEQTPEVIKVAEDIEKEIIRLQGIATKRPTAYIRDFQRKINGSILRALRGNKVNITKKGAKDSKPQFTFNLEFPEKEIIDAFDAVNNRSRKFGRGSWKSGMHHTDTAEVNVHIISTPDLPQGVVSSRGRYGQYMEIDIYIEVSDLDTVRNVSSGKTILEADPSIFGKIHKELNSTGIHELIHGIQKRRTRYGLEDTFDKKYIQPKNKQDGGKQYSQYRNQPVEVEPMARMQQVRPAQLRKNPQAPDTLDLLIKNSILGDGGGIRPGGAEGFKMFLYGIAGRRSPLGNPGLDDIMSGKATHDVAAALGKYIKDKSPFPFNPKLKTPAETAKQGAYRGKATLTTFRKELEALKKTAPCAAITAENAYLLFLMGLYNPGPADKNPKLLGILDMVKSSPTSSARARPVPINPKGCPYKSLREWEEIQNLKLIIEEELDKLLLKK